MTTLNLDVETRAIDALADPGAWAAGAATLLADLGFVLVNATHPGAPAGSHLLVALRDVPTLRHFDPEAVACYAPTRDGKVAVASLDRRVIDEFGTAARTALWGHVHVIDRLRIENRFLSFGGQLRAARIDPGLTVLDLASPGPIVRWGGHSQGTDWLAAEIGAFFGRLITAVDFRPGAEARLAVTPPAVLYAAFLAEAGRRLEEIGRRHDLRREAGAWVRREAERLRAGEGATWPAGRALLGELELDAG